MLETQLRTRVWMHVQVQRDFRSEELVTVTSAVDVQGKAILDEGPRIEAPFWAKPIAFFQEG